MSEISGIRDALMGSLGAVPGLNALGRMTNAVPPAAIIEFAGADYHDAMMSEPVYTFFVTVVVSTNDLAAAQEQLDAYVSRNGVRAAIEAAAVGDTTVTRASRYQRFQEGGMALLGSVLTVQVRP